MKNEFYTALLLGASAIVLNAGVVSEARAASTGCTYKNNKITCTDKNGKEFTVESYGGYVNYASSSGQILPNFKNNDDGSVTLDNTYNTQGSYTYKYNADNNTVTVTNGNNVYETQTYDENGKLRKKQYSGTSYEYDEFGNMTKFVSGGISQTYNYSRSTDANGNTVFTRGNTTYTYDKNGNKIKECGGTHCYNYKYDTYGNELGFKFTSSGYVEDYTYDAVYDEDGNIMMTIPNSTMSTWYKASAYDYDENGNVTNKYSGKKNSDGTFVLSGCSDYKSTWDAYGSSKTALCDKKVSMVMDSSGKMISAQLCDVNLSNCTTQYYDENGRVIGQHDKNGNPELAYDYDVLGNQLVYNDQCELIEKYDSLGTPLPLEYQVGDGLLSSVRKTRYTPAEAAEIVGNSQDNMIVMYFK